MKTIPTLSGLIASIAAVTLFAHTAAAEPLKVFILAGQSNMVGLGEVGPESSLRDRFLRAGRLDSLHRCRTGPTQDG